MRGTLLLLDTATTLLAHLDLFRENGLFVHDADRTADALRWCQSSTPDVVVVAMPGSDAASLVPQLRRVTDSATSIIVVSHPEAREAARQEGADSFLPDSASVDDLLYEIHRALILRRSGRRLPWNG